MEEASLSRPGEAHAIKLAVGRWLARKPWPQIWRDFDPRTGNRLSYGLAALTFIPLVVWSAQGGAVR